MPATQPPPNPLLAPTPDPLAPPMDSAEVAALRAQVAALQAQAAARAMTAEDDADAAPEKPAKTKTITLPDGSKATQNRTTGTWTATPGGSD